MSAIFNSLFIVLRQITFTLNIKLKNKFPLRSRGTSLDSEYVFGNLGYRLFRSKTLSVLLISCLCVR